MSSWLMIAMLGCSRHRLPDLFPTEDIRPVDVIQGSPFSAPPPEQGQEDPMSAPVRRLVSEVDAFVIEYGQDYKSNAELVLITRYNQMQDITARSYELVLEQQNYQEVSAGIFLAAVTELRYADMILNYPIPTYLSDMGQLVFQERLVELVAGLQEEAREKLELLFNNALRSGVYGIWTDQAVLELQDRYSLDFPAVPCPEDIRPTACLKAWIRFDDRTHLWPSGTWPLDKQTQQQRLDELLNTEAVLEQKEDICMQLADQAPELGILADKACLGRVAVWHAHYLQGHPQSSDAILQAKQRYLQAGLDIAAGLKEPGLSEGEFEFWHQVLVGQIRQAQLEMQAIAYATGSQIYPSAELLPLVWEYSQPATDVDPQIARQAQIHAQRLQFYANRIQKKSKKLSRASSKRFPRLHRELVGDLSALEEEAKEILAGYPEHTGNRDRILWSLGLARLQVYEELTDGALRLGEEHFTRIVSEVAREYITGIALLKAVTGRDGEQTRWSGYARDDLDRFLSVYEEEGN